MLTTQTSSNRPVGIQKISGPGRAYDDALTGILSDILKTREVRQLLITVVPEFLNVWAGRSWWKKTFSKMAGSMVDNQLSVLTEGAHFAADLDREEVEAALAAGQAMEAHDPAAVAQRADTIARAKAQLKILA